MPLPEGFRHETPISVRFADIDIMGHVNHAKYLTYMEQARIHYVQQVCSWQGNWDTLGLILAHVEVDYMLPVIFGDAVTVYTRCVRLGTKSFDLEYVMFRQHMSAAPEAVARAKTVMVAYDYQKRVSAPVPDSWRHAILEYEPELAQE
ncbi:acyl-CoA thioesterase [Phototrophicus methaneseepsis]|uniref:Acyl-CoA thioesterase n=1 Tax=Phototrophicus methaneseepsis TaxID=2710758 RepID=A0A7S8EAE9_9CHLR|nr:thioesterase family protein [Phototrophicus methaneseepsis]QPC83213.1 acyl-CoA thioesterase [Phototrophicus methaneseepsis]